MVQSDLYDDYENGIKSLDNSMIHYDYPKSNQNVKSRVTAQKEKSGNPFVLDYIYPVCGNTYLFFVIRINFHGQYTFTSERI